MNHQNKCQLLYKLILESGQQWHVANRRALTSDLKVDQAITCERFLENDTQIEWELDPTLPRWDPEAPSTPWTYMHCSLRAEFCGEFPNNSDQQTFLSEWQYVNEPFGNAISELGTKLIRLSAKVLAHPDQYYDRNYVSIRMPSKTRTELELLAYADRYWVHLFVTNSSFGSIVTLSISPEFEVAGKIAPPSIHENLALVDEVEF